MKELNTFSFLNILNEIVDDSKFINESRWDDDDVEYNPNKQVDYGYEEDEEYGTPDQFRRSRMDGDGAVEDRVIHRMLKKLTDTKTARGIRYAKMMQDSEGEARYDIIEDLHDLASRLKDEGRYDENVRAKLQSWSMLINKLGDRYEAVKGER